jgi:hypothetical protein
MKAVALQSHKSSSQVTITDTKGEVTTSKDPNEILASLVAPYPDCIKIVWSMEDFLAPITNLLPQEVVKKLNNGERVRFGDFKLFYGVGKGAVFGVDWKVLEHEQGNFYSQDKYESNIYELKYYFPDEVPANLEEVQTKGQFLIDTLHSMGMNPTKLTSPAAIYDQCILRNTDVYTVADMPEQALEIAEWSANYCREWRTCYQLGYFKEAHDYDLTAAYASVLAKIPNFKYAKYTKTGGTPPKGFFWGILKGKLDISANVSHLVSSDGKCYRGKYPDFITTSDWACMKRHNIGTFKPEAGWFVTFTQLEYPFDHLMRHLFSLRSQENELQDRLAKNMMASTWGRFIQRIGERFGDYYFPPIASMVTSKIRTMDCDFIYSNGLVNDIVSIAVDGFIALRKIDGIPADRRFGEWRLNGSGEALVLGDPWQWLLDKKPMNKTLPEMLEAIKLHPNSHAYFGLGLRFIEQSRQFEKLPLTGNDLLNERYQSTPLNIP